MRKISIFTGIILLAVNLAVAQNASSPGSKLVNSLQYSTLNWQIPKVGVDVQRLVLDNGMIVFLLPNHELPLVDANLIIRTGEIYEPKENMAIPGLTGTLMRTGGTKTMTPDSLDALLEFMAASVNIEIGEESGWGSLSVLAKDTRLGFKILADILMNPAFSEKKLRLEKEQIREDIRRRNDSPGRIIGREFNRLQYGDHPSGSILEWADVKNIKRDDLIAFHKKYFCPNNIMIAISGDFDTDTMVWILNESFAGWPKQPIDFAPIPAVKFEYKPGVYIVNKDISQANIRIGQLGIKRDNPDRYAIALMNYILGGGSFTSRLTTKVRSNEGLAYSVGSSFDISSRDYGLFTAYCQTKNSTTYKAISLMMTEIRKITESPVDTQEFAMARDAYLNQFVFNFTSPGQIVSQLMSLEYNNMPPDYYEKYLDYIRAVKIDDIQRVAQTYLIPDSLSIMVVGNPANFDAPLDDFGTVTEIPLTPPKIK
jgi:predicted Zn-dependent peptidase